MRDTKPSSSCCSSALLVPLLWLVFGTTALHHHHLAQAFLMDRPCTPYQRYVAPRADASTSGLSGPESNPWIEAMTGSKIRWTGARRRKSGRLPTARTFSRSTTALRALPTLTPSGRVQDVDQWIQWSSDSLFRLTGRTLLDEMEGLSHLSEVDSCQRYAVLSHGVQDDPIYLYFNRGALLTFQWPEEEVYRLPSRYSAPEGPTRSERTVLMQTVVDQEVRPFPTATRQTKTGELFQLIDVLLWNVYNDQGERVGQTALFDRTQIIPLA